MRHYTKFITSCLILLINSCTEKSSEENISIPQVSELASPSGFSSRFPCLVGGSDHNLYMSGIEENADTAILKYAVLGEMDWSAAKVIKKGTDWFVNWADYPMITGNENGYMLAHFLAKSSEETFSYDVNITRKPSSEETWSEPITPHQDGTLTEHGFVTMLPMGDDLFQLAWLDGRNTSSHGGEHHGAMSIRTAVMDKDGNLSEEVELDNRVCDCCQTGGAVTRNGPIIVYRDRSETEVRDMSIVRKVNGFWTEPKIIYHDNWEIAGCPVNGPRADAVGNNLAIAWFSAPENKAQVKVIFSSDGGETFGDVITIDGQSPIGRVDVVMLNENRAVVSWLANEAGKSYIKACVVNKSGEKDPPVVVAESDAARASGFPQMAKHHDDLYFAWTYLSGDTSNVKIARMKL